MRSAAERTNHSPFLAQYAAALFADDEMLFQDDGVAPVQPREKISFGLVT